MLVAACSQAHQNQEAKALLPVMSLHDDIPVTKLRIAPAGKIKNI